jgi:hypothetical protein
VCRLPLKSKSLADEIEVARALLKAKGVTLEIWGADHLSQALKGRRDLVEDFFGPAWAHAFCGRSTRQRL